MIDDFGLMELDLDKYRDLFEVLDTRDGRKSTVGISQFPASTWFDMFADNTYADAVSYTHLDVYKRQSVCHPGNLDRMHIRNCSHTFNGCNLCIIRNTTHLIDTGSCNFSVHNYVTSSTMALTAANLTSRKKKMITENLCQCFILIKNKDCLLYTSRCV